MRSIQSTLITLLAASNAAFAETTLNLTPGVSPISHDVYNLHMMIFWICVAIGLVVFGVMFYAMFYHRKSRGAKAGEFHSHFWLEISWTIIPALILVVMAVPATKVLFNMNNDAKDDLTIKVTGYQWKWHYDYLKENVSFFSNLSTPFDQIHNKAPKTEFYLREVDHPLVIPIHKKVRFLITSNDVNHAWWVPDFGVKRDALAGFINEAWTIVDKPGVYRGQCAELCGINHAFMPIVVVAMSEQGYNDWLAKQKGEATQGEADINRAWTMEALMTKGESVYAGICAACHQPNGAGLPPTFPALKGSKVAIGPIDKHIETVMNGVTGTAMQAFKNQLNDVELAAVITYERNAFGNNTNTMVQPIQIKAYRDGKALKEALTVQPVAAGAAPTAPTPTPPIGETAPTPADNAPAPTTTETGAASAPATVAPAATPAGTPAAVAPPAETPATTTTTTTTTTTAPAPVTNAPAEGSAPADSASTKAATDDLKTVMARGEKVYLNTCAACHQPTGMGMPPTFPALKNSPIAVGPVAAHIDRVMNGKQGTAMMPFKDQLNDQEIADVITYERNSWGNNMNALVKPEDIKAARQSDQNNKEQGAK